VGRGAGQETCFPHPPPTPGHGVRGSSDSSPNPTMFAAQFAFSYRTLGKDPLNQDLKINKYRIHRPFPAPSLVCSAVTLPLCRHPRSGPHHAAQHLFVSWWGLNTPSLDPAP
jgi:hypothetical protein